MGGHLCQGSLVTGMTGDRNPLFMDHKCMAGDHLCKGSLVAPPNFLLHNFNKKCSLSTLYVRVPMYEHDDLCNLKNWVQNFNPYKINL